MRVLQVITGLRIGGAERAMLQLVEAITPKLFETKIVTLTPELDALSAAPQALAEKVVALDFKRHRLQSLRAFARLIDDHAPEVIHAHMFHALLAVVLVRPLCRVRPKVCFTGHRTVHAPLRRAFLRAFRHIRSADIVFSRDGLSSVDARHTLVIPNGVDMAVTPPQRRRWGGETRRLISVGRLVEDKDCLGLVRSYARAGLANSELVFVGTGPLYDRIKSLASELGMGAQVRLMGHSENVREQLREAHVFVMHSRQEGMPLALLEAGAEGLPVVATPVGSIPSLLADNRGLLASASEFAPALRQVLGDAEAALAMGAKLRCHIAEHHSMAAVAAAHERLYTSLAAG